MYETFHRVSYYGLDWPSKRIIDKNNLIGGTKSDHIENCALKLNNKGLEVFAMDTLKYVEFERFSCFLLRSICRE